MTDTPNTPELNPQDVQDEDDLDVVVMTDEDGTEYLYDIAAAWNMATTSMWCWSRRMKMTTRS